MPEKQKHRDLVLIRLFFVAAGITTFALGVGLLVMPSFVTGLFLNEPIPVNGLFFIRFAGTSLLGFTVLNLYAYNKSEELLRLAAVVNIASLFPATIISIWTYGGDYIDNYKWLIVAEHIFFLFGFSVSLIRLHIGKMST